METLFFEFAETPVLRRRLRRLVPEAAAALRELFRDRDELTLARDPATTWRFGPAQTVASPAAVLDGVHEKLLLGITDDGWCERLGAREWWDFTAESRLLAWMLAHGSLLEDLGRILREPLMPSALNETALPLPGTLNNVPLDFSAIAADGRVTRGWVTMSAAMVSRLASHAGWRRSAPATAPWEKLRGTLRMELRRVLFHLAELSASEIGDVLILGGRAQCWRNLHLTLVAERDDTRLRTWNACYDGARLTVKPDVSASAMELIMSENTNAGQSTTSSAGAADNIPVSLDFDLGSTSLPLGELAALKPGYVFELPGSLEKRRVVIRANGTRVGYGELVAVGDVLGVQLLAIEIDGLR